MLQGEVGKIAELPFYGGEAWVDWMCYGEYEGGFTSFVCILISFEPCMARKPSEGHLAVGCMEDMKEDVDECQ